MHISPLTEGQSRIQLFGSQEKYLEHRRDWEERALSEEVCDPMQHIFRCFAEQGRGSDVFWDEMTTPKELSWKGAKLDAEPAGSTVFEL